MDNSSVEDRPPFGGFHKNRIRRRRRRRRLLLVVKMTPSRHPQPKTNTGVVYQATTGDDSLVA
jgi:hypothetical protein